MNLSLGNALLGLATAAAARNPPDTGTVALVTQMLQKAVTFDSYYDATAAAVVTANQLAAIQYGIIRGQSADSLVGTATIDGIPASVLGA